MVGLVSYDVMQAGKRIPVKIRETYCLHVGNMNLNCHENPHFMCGILFAFLYFDSLMLLRVLIVFGIT